MLRLYVGADNLIEMNGVRRTSDGVYINTATVTFALKDSDLTAVSGGTGTLAYVSSSDGDYRGTMESTVTLTSGAYYWLELTAVADSTINDFRRIQCKAVYHGERSPDE